MKNITNFFSFIKMKFCIHKFKKSEVINLKINPSCIKCGKKLIDKP